MTDHDPSEQIDRLAEAFVSSWRRGDKPSVSEYAARHPALADDIRELFPLLTTMEDLKQEVATATPLGTQLGDYRLVREIGRGGMGVVYEAVQETLGRRVALKVLPAHTTRDPRYLERFRTEAQAAGRLQHPNIVPVIGYGEHDGVHYYTMQFVEGRGVDELLAEARSDATDDSRARFTRAARVILAAAEGVAAAHAHGVLHRDLKPSNLMLDAEGKVWITDFGLCKEVGSDDLTQSGDILGTLRYMPPERLQGDSDVQCDVYGLGITLYEMLTLAPAYGDEDRVQLFARIAKEEPRRPRAIDPRIPSDLEAIVLKAIARDRRHRYATADALASDLRAFLEDRPIAARPPTFGTYLRSFVRRHKPLAITTVLAALALIGSTVVYVLNVRQKEADARFQNYVAHIAAAEAALETGDEDTARRLLTTAPAEYRNWEWHHLQARADENLSRIPVGRTAHGVAYSPDGRWIAVGADRELVIVRGEDGSEHARLPLASYATMVRWSPAGGVIAVATTGGVEVWSWPAQQRLYRVHETDHITHVAFGPDGRLLVSGGHEGLLRAWSAADGAGMKEIPVHTVIHALDVHPDGERVVTGTWDGHVTLWDVAAGQRLWSRKAARLGLHGVCCVGESLIATATQAPHTSLWSTEDGTLVRVLSHNDQGGGLIVFPSPDGRYLLVGADRDVHIWSTRTWSHVARRVVGSRINDIAVHPSGTRFAIALPRGRLVECALDTGDPARLVGHIDDVLTIAYAPSGAYFVTGGQGGVVRVWDADTREQARAWIGQRWTVTCLAVSPDSTQVAVGDAKGDVVLWDVARDEPVQRLAAHTPPRTWGVAYMRAKNRLATVGTNGALRVWDTASGNLVAETKAAEGLRSLEVHPRDGRLVTGDYEGAIRVHDPVTLEVLATLRGHTGIITDLAFSRDGALLASVSDDGSLRLWDVETGVNVRTCRAAQPAASGGSAILGVAVSHDGTRIATSARDGTARLWEARSGRLVVTLGELHGWVQKIAFSPDGEELLAVTGSAEVRVWDTRPNGRRFVRTPEEAALRARGAELVAALRAREADPDAVIAGIQSRTDLGAAAKEAALRAAHAWRGSEEGLVAWLWHTVTAPRVAPLRHQIARGMAADMVRAAGHRNTQDSRRPTLWGAVTSRSGDHELALKRLRRSRMLNEARHPELFAVDLAFLAMSHAALEQEEQAAAALEELEALVAGQPSLRTARIEQFLSEARAAVAAK